MRIFETFTKRQKKQKDAGKQDVYQYDVLPAPLRVQIVHILQDLIHPWNEDRWGAQYSTANEIWLDIFKTATTEAGVFNLGNEYHNPHLQVCNYILTAEVVAALDVIEIAFNYIYRNYGHMNEYQAIQGHGLGFTPASAFDELNRRFQEHSVGYRFEAGQLRRIDSYYIHSAVVKPAISLLQQEGFNGPLDEFEKAHSHYRTRNYKEAIAEALKSFESTMKAICVKNKWDFPEHAAAKALIDKLMQNNLVPASLQNHFSGLRTTLEAGLPTVRNKNAGHGQGIDTVEVPEYLASYALHLAATNIVFLIEAHKALHKKA